MAKQQKKFMKHIMTGISYMIPIIVAGGILGALAKALGGWDIGSAVEAGATPFSNLNPFTWAGFWWGVNKLSSYAMDFAVAVMTAGAAYSIAGRPGIVPGLIIGYCSSQSKAGFLGGILMAFIIGAVVNWMKGWKLPKWCEGLKPVMIIPVCSTFLCGMIFLCVFSIPLAWIMDVFQQWIISLNGSAKAVIGGMTPPIGLFIATVLKKDKFTATERETAKTVLPMGLCFITEGVLPFVAADPARFIPCSMFGSAVAGAIAVGSGCESVAGHGGIFVVPMMENPMMFIVALIIGSVVTGVAYAMIKLPSEDDTVAEEEDLDIDLDINIV